MLRVSPLLVGCLVTVCAIPALINGQEQHARPSSGFSGRAIVHRSGTPVPPDEAKVWILFGSDVLYEGMPDRQAYVDSAALQFENQIGRFLAQDKKSMQSLVAAAKDKSTNDTEKQESLNQYKGYMIRATDQALAATMAWAQAHSNKTWQVKTLTPEADGTWSINDLIPGTYHIIVRARFGDYDADWEAGITVKPSETFTIPDGPPGLFHQAKSR